MKLYAVVKRAKSKENRPQMNADKHGSLLHPRSPYCVPEALREMG
jgi:hypothetical protein